MVNHGVSRGCGTCKIRKKKCDETRPICKACLRVKRPCLGYKTESELVFRRYQVDKGPPRDRFQDDVPSSALGSLPDDDLKRHLLDVFLRDYCVRPSDPLLSRGYLQGAASVIHEAGSDCATSNVARIVALAGLGQRHGQPQLVQKAQLLYRDELLAFVAKLTDKGFTSSRDSLFAVVLLGLYEMILPSSESDHAVHALGITALLQTSNSPFGLLQEILKDGHWKLSWPGILSPPATAELSFPGLDPFVLGSQSIFLRAQRCLVEDWGTSASDVRALCSDAERLFDGLTDWPRRQHPWWQPQSVGIVDKNQISGVHGALFWPGRIDEYPDYWIAGVWTVFRKGVIALANIACQCANALPSDTSISAVAARMKRDAGPILKDLISSVPYFLVRNVRSVLEQGEQPEPGAPAGGIMVMHALFITATQREIVSRQEEEYLRACLQWMGEWVGIGHARELGQRQDWQGKLSIADAHTVVWAGMMP